MKIKVKTKTLKAAVGAVGVAIQGRTTLPILGNVKIDAVSNGLIISATDLDIFATEAIDAQVAGKPESFTVSHRILSMLLNRVSASETSIELKDKTIAAVVAGEVSANLETLPAEEFPPNLSIEGAKSFKCATGELLKPLRMVQHAINTSDPSRYTLMGVHFKSTKAGTDIVATNGRAMAMYESELKTEEMNVIIPEHMIQAILKNISGGEEVSASYTEGVFAVECGDTQLRSKLIEGTYAGYRQVIPDKPGKEVFAADRKELVQGITTASMFLNTKEVGIDMTGKEKQIIVTCNSRARVEILGTELKGQSKIKIKFDHVFVLDTLNAMTEDVARIECEDERSVMMFREGKFTGLVMPLRREANDG